MFFDYPKHTLEYFIAGYFQFKESMQVRRKTVLIVGIITIILGFIIAFNPNITIVTVGILIGVPVMIIGLANIFFAMNLKNVEYSGLVENKGEEN